MLMTAKKTWFYHLFFVLGQFFLSSLAIQPNSIFVLTFHLIHEKKIRENASEIREGMHRPFFWRRNPTKTLGFLLPWFPPWEGMHSYFFWRRNPTKTLGFLLPWISPWFFVGFLLSPPPCAQSFPRKPSFLVLADFFPSFFKSKQLLGFLGVYMMK